MILRHCSVNLSCTTAILAVLLFLLSSCPLGEQGVVAAAGVKARTAVRRELWHREAAASPFLHRGILNHATISSVIAVEDLAKRQPENYRNRRATTSSPLLDNIQCNPETLEAISAECKASAVSSTLDPDPLMFCGRDCRDLVNSYRVACGLQESTFTVNGACKRRGGNLTIECIYAVVIIDSGLIACSKRSEVIDMSHGQGDVGSLIDSSRSYIEEQCCVLDVSHTNTTDFIVYIDRNNRLRTEPPLQPSWLGVNASAYLPIVDIITSDRCIQKPSTSYSPPPAATTSSSSSSSLLSDRATAVVENKACPTLQSRVRLLLQFFCVLSVLLALCW